MKTFFGVLLFAITTLASAQGFNDTEGIDVNVFKGNAMLHSPDLTQVISGHPEGVMISFVKKTHGHEEWHSVYNFPDYGAYILYEDMKSEILGKNYAAGAFYNFYFLNRHLTFKIAQGIAMTTRPYDKVTNPKNSAFGSKILANTDFVLHYKKENIIDKFGLQTGFIFTHFSNGRTKSPNSGLNTYAISIGVNYNLENTPNRPKDSLAFKMKLTEPIRYNFVLRTGFNESPIVGSGLKPFYHIAAYADKRINRKSALQLGTELFLTTSNKEYIRFRSISFPEEPVDANTDYKRVGIFIGHELFINRISIETQLGYYIYQPYKFDVPVYDRLGMKYYVSKKIYTGLSVKTHGFLAEALEVVMGVRL
jgi:hypothetical protein